MKENSDGFTMYLNHPNVVLAALYRVGILKIHHDYADWVERAMIIYVEYYKHYYDPIETVEDVQKFNRLAGFNIYVRIKREFLRELRNRDKLGGTNITNLVEVGAEPAVTPTFPSNTELSAIIHELLLSLTQREQIIFYLLYAEELTVKEISHRLQLSIATVNRARINIRKKYQEIVAIEN